MKQANTQKRILILLGVVATFLVAFLLVSFLMKSVGKQKMPAREIAGPDAAGILHALSDERGEDGAVLIFFDTNTPQATNLLETISSLEKDYQSKVIAIAINGEYDHQKKEIAKLKLSKETLVLYDVENKMAETYNVSATPVTYFIDKNGMMLKKYSFLGSIKESTLKEAFSAID